MHEIPPDESLPEIDPNNLMKMFIRAERTRRRELFNNLRDQFDRVKYNFGEDNPYLQSLHTIRSEHCTTTAWVFSIQHEEHFWVDHLVTNTVNDNQEDSNLYYGEYALDLHNNLFSAREGELPRPPGTFNWGNLNDSFPDFAMIRKKTTNNQCEVKRGAQAPLLLPPIEWNPKPIEIVDLNISLEKATEFLWSMDSGTVNENFLGYPLD
jgi:hypothetical protein